MEIKMSEKTVSYTHLGIHDFVGFKFIINHLYAGFFFKHGDRIGIDVFPPVVDDDLSVFAGSRGSAAAAGCHACNQTGAQGSSCLLYTSRCV